MNAPETLVDELAQRYEKMPAEIRALYDTDDVWEHVLATAAAVPQQSGELTDLAKAETAQASRLADISENLAGMDERVNEWQGPGREAFSQTVELVTARISDLAELGKDGATLLTGASVGRCAIESLISDLVETSIDFATSSLVTARSLASVTAGVSMATWLNVNLRQIDRLRTEVDEAAARAGSLADRLGGLLGELAEATGEISDDMRAVAARLGSSGR